MVDLYRDFAYSTLQSNLTASQTTLGVDKSERLPTSAILAKGNFYLTIVRDPLEDSEIVRVTAKSAETGAATLTIVRGQLGTVAKTHVAPLPLKGALTAEEVRNVRAFESSLTVPTVDLDVYKSGDPFYKRSADGVTPGELYVLDNGTSWLKIAGGAGDTTLTNLVLGVINQSDDLLEVIQHLETQQVSIENSLVVIVNTFDDLLETLKAGMFPAAQVLATNPTDTSLASPGNLYMVGTNPDYELKAIGSTGALVTLTTLFKEVKSELGVVLPVRRVIAFSGPGVTVTDDPANGEIDVLITGGFYQEVAQGGTIVPQRSVLNFTGAGVAVNDDAANDRTNIAIAGGGGGGGGANSSAINILNFDLGTQTGGQTAYTWTPVTGTLIRGFVSKFVVSASGTTNLFDIQVRSDNNGAGELMLEAINVDGIYDVSVPWYYQSDTGFQTMYIGVKNKFGATRTFTMNRLRAESFT